MKILHISKYYYPFIGGVEQTARDIVNSIDGCEQRVFCFNHKKGNVTDQIDGNEVFRCGCFAKIASQSLSISYRKNLKRELKKFNPDIVVFHYPNPFAAHFILRKLKKYPHCKLILWWHLDITKQKILGKVFKRQTERLLKRADRVIATSPNYLESSPFLSRYKEKCIVIPSCINEARLEVTDEIISQSEQIRNRNEGKTICFAIGRHVPYKGYNYLIRASSLLDNNYKIYLAGEGELTPKLKALAKNDNKIEFLGRLSDDAMKAYMLACDIYCFPSITRNEAFGLALAEAMSFGKPAITFTIEGSGVNYVCLKDKTGLEVENRNAKAYAEAIKALAHDESLRRALGAAAKQRAKRLCSFEKFKGSVQNLFSKEE